MEQSAIEVGWLRLDPHVVLFSTLLLRELCVGFYAVRAENYLVGRDVLVEALAMNVNVVECYRNEIQSLFALERLARGGGSAISGAIINS